MTFPSSPADGQIVEVANIVYQYSSAINSWRRIIGPLNVGNLSASGNITASYFIGNGSQLTGLPAGYANSNVASYGETGWAGNIIPSANATYNLGNASNQWKSLYVSNTTIYLGGVPLTTTANTLTVAGNTVLTTSSGNADIVGNITTTGYVSATGNVTGNYILGNGSQLTGLPEQYGNSNVAAYLPTYTGNLTAGNISATGNITGGNIITGGSSGNITGANVITANVFSATGNVTGAYIIGNGSQLTGLPAGYANSNAASYFASGAVSTDIITTANVTGAYIIGNGSTLSSITGANVSGTVANATYAVSAGTAGTVTTAAQPNITSVGTLSSLSVTGNITGNYIVGNGSTLTSVAGANVTGTVANATYAVSAGTAGTVTTAAQPNITSVGILASVTITGNATAGNVLTGGAISSTGNITTGNILTAGVMSSTGNATAGNVLTAGTVSAGANVVGANIATAGLITAAGNINSGGIVNTANLNGASGLTLTTGAGSINLYPTSGNIVVNSTYITGVANPVQNQDVATKSYVDNYATTGIAYHLPVTAATTANLATTTGGTISYTQPNGAGNGVGALLTTTGSFNLIDTANVQTVGTRILVKNEANAAFNGVYYWANATTIIRTTDADEYGPDSIEQLSINDYFFVQSGNINLGSAWICNGPSGTITFGTSNISFSQFSSSQDYSANTSAGISLSGTVINAKVDGVTTAFDGGGNISVKAGANLTTPNIGAATGTSLSVTGNATAGNILTAGQISATGNVTGNYIIGDGSQLTNITLAGAMTWTTQANTAPTGKAAGSFWYDSYSGVKYQYYNDGNSNVWVDQSYPSSFSSLAVSGNATVGGTLAVTGTLSYGNITTTGTASVAGNIDGGNLRTSGLITATGNIIGGNILTAGLVSATGNATAGNILTAGLVSATANITGGNILTAGLISATSTITSAANITGGNILTAGLISATSTITSAANITGGNITTAGLITATGNARAGNILTAGLVSATGNVYGNNIIATGLVNATGNILSSGIISAAGNLIGSNVSIGIGNVNLGNINNNNGNGVGNIGSSSSYFNTVFAKATSAQYADLAEMYVADQDLEPGTVVEFGGAYEIRASQTSHSTQVAGIVSTNPSYLMNAAQPGDTVVAVALTGRVPCRVVGQIRKGDRLVASEFEGVATVLNMEYYEPGCIIGKALENYDSNQVGVVEVAVGRT